MRGPILQKALVCEEMFVRTYRGNPAMGRDVARAYFMIGKIHALLEHDVEAEQAYRSALLLQQARMRDAPEDLSNAKLLNVGLARLSELYFRTSRPDQAVGIYAATVRELESLPAPKLEGEAASSFLGEVYAGLASALRSTGRFAEAMAAWDGAIKYHRGPDRDQLLVRRAACQACLGDHAGAAEAVQAATLNRPERPEVWYNAACALGLCCPAALRDLRVSADRRQDLANQYARQAMHLLSLAAAENFFVDFELDLRLLETDKDLDPLRSRPDFQKLLAEQRDLSRAQHGRATPDR
jgi:tetratricopeptide (TPR) repeat protein